jgi:hypothetical protein
VSAFERVMIVKVWIALRFGTFVRAWARCSAIADAALGPIIAEAAVGAHTDKTTRADRPPYRAFKDLPMVAAYIVAHHGRPVPADCVRYLTAYRLLNKLS